MGPSHRKSAGLDLAAKEYFAMRSEMADSVRLELNLILSALLVLGGAAGAAGSNLGGVGVGGGALLLQIASAFAYVILIAGIGIANGWFILEDYVSEAAKDLAEAAASPGLPNLFTFQTRVRRFTRSGARKDQARMLLAYGVPGLVAAVALIFATLAGLAGSFLPAAEAIEPWRTILGIADGVLGLTAALYLIISAIYRERWHGVLGYE